MRRLTEPEAHRARVDLSHGKFPKGLKIRCAWCGSVASPEEGLFVSAEVRGTGTTQFFKCSKCAGAEPADSAA